MTTAVANLLKARVAEKRETRGMTFTRRQDGDLNIGVLAPAAELAGLGIEVAADEDATTEPDRA